MQEPQDVLAVVKPPKKHLDLKQKHKTSQQSFPPIPVFIRSNHLFAKPNKPMKNQGIPFLRNAPPPVQSANLPVIIKNRFRTLQSHQHCISPPSFPYCRIPIPFGTCSSFVRFIQIQTKRTHARSSNNNNNNKTQHSRHQPSQPTNKTGQKKKSFAHSHP